MGEGDVFGEVILSGGLLGIRLILVGRKGSHVIECSYFHRSQFNHSDPSIPIV